MSVNLGLSIVCWGKKYRKAWKQVWSPYKHIRNLNFKCNSAKYVASLKQYLQRWKRWLGTEYRSSLECCFLNICYIYKTSSSSWGYTEVSSTGSEGGVPGGIQATPFSPAHIHRASASLRVESRSIWPLNSLMNFRSVSKSICSPIILLRYFFRIATQTYRCRCSLR